MLYLLLAKGTATPETAATAGWARCSTRVVARSPGPHRGAGGVILIVHSRVPAVDVVGIPSAAQLPAAGRWVLSQRLDCWSRLDGGNSVLGRI